MTNFTLTTTQGFNKACHSLQTDRVRKAGAAHCFRPRHQRGAMGGGPPTQSAGPAGDHPSDFRTIARLPLDFCAGLSPRQSLLQVGCAQSVINTCQHSETRSLVFLALLGGEGRTLWGCGTTRYYTRQRSASPHKSSVPGLCCDSMACTYPSRRVQRVQSVECEHRAQLGPTLLAKESHCRCVAVSEMLF